MYRYGDEEIRAVERVLRSGQWFRYGDPAAGHLQEAAQFESEWALAMGTCHACLTNSGTSSLMCCYAGLQVGPGDEVIIPGYTWIASALAPLALGAIPVIVDVDESLMIDPDAVERAITPRTKAIDPVHMNGFACDMDRIMEIARRRGVRVVEDACQCDGGLWKDGRKLGAIGDMGAYSFNIYKVVSSGDGGAWVANERETYERGLMFHDGGTLFRPHAAEIGLEFFAGINLRGSEILAAIMRVQLSRLDGIVSDLHRVRSSILDAIDGAPGVRLFPLNGGRRTGTGATIGLRFSDEAQARSFCALFAETGLRYGTLPGLAIDSGRHVYCNWEPIMAKRGSYCEAADPFCDPRNAASRVEYAKDMLPNTLTILRRSVLIAVNPDWGEAQATDVADAIRCAAARVADGEVR